MDRTQDRTLKARLPVDHPEFRYPKARNLYEEKNRELKGIVYSDHEAEEHRGKWKEHFKVDLKAPLHVEIGCNAGHVCVEWAKQNPSHLYVGVDWKFKAIHRAAQKVLKLKLSQMKFFRAHAERLSYMFGPGEIDRLYLFFPDPWPKRAHWKNRFVTAKRLTELSKLLTPGGTLEIRTDHAGYFDWMLEEVGKVGESFKVLESTRDRHGSHPNPKSLKIPDITLFEGIFIREGIKINRLVLQRLT